MECFPPSVHFVFSLRIDDLANSLAETLDSGVSLSTDRTFGLRLLTCHVLDRRLSFASSRNDFPSPKA